MIHVTTTINGDETEFVCDPRETLLDVLRDPPVPDWRERRLRHRRLRRVFCHRRRQPSFVPASSSALKLKARKSARLKASPPAKTCTRSSRNSWIMQPCNAGSARRAFWSRPRRFWKSTRTQPRPRFAIGWPAIFAAAPAMTKSSVPSWTRPKTCGVLHNGF